MRRLTIGLLLVLLLAVAGCAAPADEHAPAPTATATILANGIATPTTVAPVTQPATVTVMPAPTRQVTATATAAPTEAPAETPSPEPAAPASDTYVIGTQVRSHEAALSNVALELRSARVADGELILEIAFQSRSDWPFSIMGEWEPENALLRDAAGRSYLPTRISDGLRQIDPPDGFAPGGANVGEVAFAAPADAGPYELQLLSYTPIEFVLDQLAGPAATARVPTATYFLGRTLHSPSSPLAPITLRVASIRVTEDEITFHIAFTNTSHRGYRLTAGPLSSEAWLIDADRRQQSPLSVSESLRRSIAPADGWDPGEEHEGTITFARPAAMQELRFVFPQYNALTLLFEDQGLVDARVTSPTGGEPAPTPQPAPDEALAASLTNLLRRASDAVVYQDRAGFLATIAPAAQEEQEQVFDRLLELPFATYRMRLLPGETFPTVPVDRVEDVGVELSYTWVSVGYRNAFVHILRVTFAQEQGEWRIERVAFEENPPFWRAGDVVVAESEHFLLLTRPDVAEQLPELVGEVEDAYEYLAGRGLPLEDHFVAYFTGSLDDFRLLTGTVAKQVLGTALWRYDISRDEIEVHSRAFYINGEAFRRHDAEYAADVRVATIAHEIVHLALAPSTRFFTPAWLTEGVAVYFAGQNIEALRRQLVSRGMLDEFNLEQLTLIDALGGHHMTIEETQYAYIYSGEVIAYLAATFGDTRLLEFYRSYGDVPPAQVRDQVSATVSSDDDGMEAASSLAAFRLEVTVEAVDRFFGLTLAQLDSEAKEWMRR